MKTIVSQPNFISCYLIKDGVAIIPKADSIVIGEPLEIIIGELNINNTVIFENVTPPDDWARNKYIFDGLTWSTNPSWVAPVQPIRPVLPTSPSTSNQPAGA